jgi:hypothetical protein
VTNDNPIEFLYGAAMLQTEPPEATVQDGNGRDWGITPLNLPELVPGTLQFTLHRAGYEPVAVSLEISANQTNIYQTNLVSTGYTGGMKSARQFMAVSDYDKALQTVGDALIAKPDDADAIILQREATGLGDIQKAQTSGNRGDYIGGEEYLTMALQALPDNAQAKQLLADYKTHEPEQIERQRVERLNRPKTVYDDTLGQLSRTPICSTITNSKPVCRQKMAAVLIVNALITGNQNTRSRKQFAETGNLFDYSLTRRQWHSLNQWPSSVHHRLRPDDGYQHGNSVQGFGIQSQAQCLNAGAAGFQG